jgi:hypothetical protein
MLYKICIFQIFVYLFASPFIRTGLGIDATKYSFGIAAIFTLLFIAGGIASSTKRRPKRSIDNPLAVSRHGTIMLTAWAILYSALSLKHGLINRRIGTNEAAMMFSEIPAIDLVVFRVFELLFPFIIAHLIIKLIKLKLNLPDKFLALCLGLALVLSGLAFSRSQTFFLLACSAIILQNSLDRRQFRKLLISTATAAVLMFILVSVYRMTFNPPDNLSAHFSDEILKRVDGLELISLLIESYGYPPTGINPSAIAAPIVSSTPFLPAAVELKANALTTIKSIILALEFGSLQGDTNSFIILDVYYWGGVIGLMLSAVFLGYAAKKVDQRILISKGIAMNSLLIALACNIIYMEREFINILIGTARDFAIYSIILFIICKKRKIRPTINPNEDSLKFIPADLNQQPAGN